MRLILSCFALLFFLKDAAAQQRPQYTQYVLNNYILNPALSGIENYTDVKLSARDQWVGIDGAPKTMYFSIQGPIGKKDFKTTATSFQVPGENPRGEAYWENYTASAPHHGLGLTIVNDRTGNFNHLTAAASYAYHVGLSVRTNLAAGFSLGVSKFSRLIDKSDFGGGVTTHPAQTGNGTMFRMKPDLAAGLWLYNAAYFVGLSVQQILPQRVDFTDDNSYGGKLLPHFFATAGYRFMLNEEVNVLPSVMIKYVSATPTTPQFDVNIKVQYLDLFWLGSSYRWKDSYAAMIGLNVSNTFNLGYSYDRTISPLSAASKGTHEIILGFLLGNTYGDTCPKNVW